MQKNQGPDSRDEKVICLLSNFWDRHWQGGAVCNLKGILLGSLDPRKIEPQSRESYNLFMRPFLLQNIILLVSGVSEW